MSESEPLILCPFCGATTQDTEYNSATGNIEPCIALHSQGGRHVVKCIRCGCSGPVSFIDPDNAVSGWNYRQKTGWNAFFHELKLTFSMPVLPSFLAAVIAVMCAIASCILCISVLLDLPWLKLLKPQQQSRHSEPTSIIVSDHQCNPVAFSTGYCRFVAQQNRRGDFFYHREARHTLRDRSWDCFIFPQSHEQAFLKQGIFEATGGAGYD